MGKTENSILQSLWVYKPVDLSCGACATTWSHVSSTG